MQGLEKPGSQDIASEMNLQDNSTEERSACGSSMDPLAETLPIKKKTLRLNKRKLTRRVLQKINQQKRERQIKMMDDVIDVLIRLTEEQLHGSDKKEAFKGDVEKAVKNSSFSH